MSLKDYQNRVHQWASQFEQPYFPPEFIALRMTEEVGEFAREVNHKYGPKKKKDDEVDRRAGDELADIIFTAICYANREGLNLDDYMEGVLETKCKIRDNERYKKG